MYKAFLTIALLVTTQLLFPDTVSAEVVINEVFPNPSGDSSEPSEFVELYNTDENESVDISGYKLEESKSFTIDESSIEPLGFVTFTRSDTGLALNNSGDTISLVDIEGEVLDSFTFDDTDEDISWSRYPDGFGEFVLTTTVTSGLPNAQPPSPTPTPPPSYSPTSTNTPTPIPTSTPTPTQVITNTPTSRMEQEVDEIASEVIPVESDKNVLSSVSDGENGQKDDKPNIPVPALLFIVGGLVFIGGSVYLKFFKKSKK